MAATEQQAKAIQAPVNCHLRVLAPPGSGKTYLLSHRYAYLVTQGVSPSKIIAVTFSKSMATELGERIITLTPSAISEQICTIHALCYRMLRADGDKRRVAKEWEVKTAIEEATKRHDLDAGWEEVRWFLDWSKQMGIASDRDRELIALFTERVPQGTARQLASIRQDVDRAMSNNGILTFGDMLLEVDIKMREKPAYRKSWQAKYSHVVVDESQDVSGQALRILITLAVDWPDNPMYNTR